MRPFLPCAALLILAACAPDPVPNAPPAGRFYFPTGIAFDPGSNDAGMLFVASSNFDKRYDRGALTLVSLAGIGLPEVGATDGGGQSVHLDDLKLGPNQQVDIQSFAGDIALFHHSRGVRAFVASRAENAPLQYVDAVGTELECPYAAENASKDCFTNAPSLVELEDTENGVPRAPAPASVFVSAGADGGQVFVGHMLNADSPTGTKLNEQSFIVRTDAQDPAIIESTDPKEGSFISIGQGGTASVIATQKWILATGRYVNETSGGQLLRLVNRADPAVRIGAGIESVFHALESRGLALNEPVIPGKPTRLFLAARDPDVLLVVDITGLDSDAPPTATLVRHVPLPDSPNDVKIIAREPRAPLVVVSCSGDDSVVIYDDDIGAVVSRLGAGNQPYGIAVQRIGDAARIFVSNYADGRVAVIEMTDVRRASEARIIAHLGRSQQCLVNGRQSSTECQSEPQ